MSSGLTSFNPHFSAFLVFCDICKALLKYLISNELIFAFVFLQCLFSHSMDYFDLSLQWQSLLTPNSPIFTSKGKGKYFGKYEHNISIELLIQYSFSSLACLTQRKDLEIGTQFLICIPWSRHDNISLPQRLKGVYIPPLYVLNSFTLLHQHFMKSKSKFKMPWHRGTTVTSKLFLLLSPPNNHSTDHVLNFCNSLALVILHEGGFYWNLCVVYVYLIFHF